MKSSANTDNQNDKSNIVSAPSVSLPKGGGAIKGIGEKFSANPVTGTGSMSVPIALSPGRGGFGPQLSLSYDSGAGQGVFGLGWQLAQPNISRKTDKGLPRYLDEENTDVFIISGAEDLVPILENGVSKKVKHVGWLAGAGGFLDSFGGGGWGPLVTSTLISKGRSPRYVIGSVSLTEFFITLASALTFFSMLGINHWPIILGLIVGGIAAAPLAARLAGKLPMKTMFICVGALVIIWSLRILLKAVGVF